MTELLNQPESQAKDTLDTAVLQEMFDAQSVEPNTPSAEYQELPTQASLLDRAVDRINKFAVNRAHSKALQEYRGRDYDGYIGHLANIADSTEATPMAKATAEMAVEREWRREDREKMTEKAKGKLRGFGRSTLARLKDAGTITLGIGILSAEVAKSSTIKLGEKAGDGFISGMKKIESSMDTAGAKIETFKQNHEADKIYKEALTEDRRRDKQQEKALKMNEKLDRAQKQKTAAAARKQARHEKWAKVKENITKTRKVVVDGTKKGAEFTHNTIKINAEFASAAARESARKRRVKLGRFAARARAAGEGAIEGWKSV